MANINMYTLELIAKGWLSRNKDQPEHVKEAELVKLLAEIKEVSAEGSNNIFDSSWYMKKFEKMYTGRGLKGTCEMTGNYCENLVRIIEKSNKLSDDTFLLVDERILYELFENSQQYKIKKDTVLL